jgi:competence protein ComGF
MPSTPSKNRTLLGLSPIHTILSRKQATKSSNHTVVTFEFFNKNQENRLTDSQSP